MTENRVILDKESFKALSSESRIDLLKRLDNQRATVSQLSRDMQLSKQAILKHLTKLMEAGLVNKKEDKRKWIYYSLSMKGVNILHPERVKILVLLSLAVFSLAGGVISLWGYAKGKIIDDELKQFMHDPALLYIGVTLVLIWCVLTFVAWRVWKNKKCPLDIK